MKDHIKEIIDFDIVNNNFNGYEGKIIEFDSIPEKNIYLPFQLYIPNNIKTKVDLIVTIRTPYVSFDTFDRALENAKYEEINGKKYLMILKYVKLLSQKYKLPVLIPIIPRCPGLDTYYYGYRMFHNDFEVPIRLNEIGFSKFTKEDLNNFKNLDAQISSMIDFSKDYLKSKKVDVDDKVIFTGYSSGSKFANFYSILNPKKVKMIIAGGTGGLLLNLIKNYNDFIFDYPIGINDLDFDLENFRKIKQFYYIGLDDTNDPVYPKMKYKKDKNGKKQIVYDNDGNIEFDLDENGNYKFKDDNGSYTDYQVNAIIKSLGFNIQKRFDFNKKNYLENGIECVFKKYPGDHNTVSKNESLYSDVEEFYINNR